MLTCCHEPPLLIQHTNGRILENASTTLYEWLQFSNKSVSAARHAHLQVCSWIPYKHSIDKFKCNTVMPINRAQEPSMRLISPYFTDERSD